ncbi:MAG: hypothetical protein KIT19_11800 [Phycisphaeraceae bacterium]|nr:hypothetical protein [Phycisphaeraceae bacterium]
MLGDSMILCAASPVAPAWIVFPLGGFTLVVVLWHLWTVIRSDAAPAHATRRRIRLANAGVMLCLVPLVTFAFGVATTASPRFFALAWLAVMGLLALMVLLAMMDSANTARMHLTDRADLRAQLRQAIKEPIARVPDRHP